MTVLPFPCVPLSGRCCECGAWKLSGEMEDGRCRRCLGEKPERVPVVRPSEVEPADWMVIETRVPCHSGPFTLKEALSVAKFAGGLVRPWAAGPPKALGVFPNYGQMHRGER